jgi:hypothetical protein
MKKILLISAILLSAFCYKTEAQVRVNVNIGLQPVWGPVGYDYVDYYYLPDMDVYYDVPRGLFVFYDHGRWNFAASLPGRYGRYDLYHSYKVVINQRNPWDRDEYYRNHYRSYRERYQPVIRDSRDNRYFTERERYNRDGGGDRHYGDRDERYGDRGDYGRDNGRGNGGRNNGRGNGGEHGRGNHGGHDRD